MKERNYQGRFIWQSRSTLFSRITATSLYRSLSYDDNPQFLSDRQTDRHTDTDRIMETQIYRKTLGGSYSNIYIMPIDAPFPEGAGQGHYIHTHTRAHTHTHKQNGNNTGLLLSQPFGSGEKGECENEWAREKEPRMRCVIQPHHGGLGQLGDQESLPIVHTCHRKTHIHTCRTESRLFRSKTQYIATFAKEKWKWV